MVEPAAKNQTCLGSQYRGIGSPCPGKCGQTGVKDLNIHDLRGRADMDARKAGGLEAAKERLGHKSIRMTESYGDGKAPRKAKSSR